MKPKVYFHSIDAVVRAVGASVCWDLPDPEIVDSDIYRAIIMDTALACAWSEIPKDFPTAAINKFALFRKVKLNFFGKYLLAWERIE